MMFTPPLQGILFDFDGLLLDTETPIFQAWQRKFKEYGRELLLEEWAEILGKSNDELGPLEGFLNKIPNPEDKKRIQAEVSREERSLVLEEQPLSGAEELIKKAHQEGIKLGIVSSSDQDWVHGHLERLGLLDYFHHTSCADEVEVAKPDPALYQLGLRKMGTAADSVVVLEDSPNGVLAAKRAGLYCIAVPNQLTRQLSFHEEEGMPDRILKTLDDFPWDDLMRTDS
jgi:HAD superfamily hydrolase (TIGR01509 family)